MSAARDNHHENSSLSKERTKIGVIGGELHPSEYKHSYSHPSQVCLCCTCRLKGYDMPSSHTLTASRSLPKMQERAMHGCSGRLACSCGAAEEVWRWRCMYCSGDPRSLQDAYAQHVMHQLPMQAAHGGLHLPCMHLCGMTLWFMRGRLR